MRGSSVDLLAVLREARRPYDEELAREAVERREQEAKRERLCSDPEALRAHLRTWGERNRSSIPPTVPSASPSRSCWSATGVLGGVERDA